MTKHENFDVNVKYDGYKYRIYYFSIDDLEEELAQVGKFLDSLDLSRNCLLIQKTM